MTTPREIREYVIKQEIVDLPAAIRSMTHLPASVYRLGIDRGAFTDGRHGRVLRR